MNHTCYFILCMSIVFLGIGNVISSKEIKQLKAQLDDPHHCVSICVEEFERMGC